MWCVHVRTTRRADTPCTGVGKRVGAILGKSVLLPGARRSRCGPERVGTRRPGPAPCVGPVPAPMRGAGSTGPGGTRSHQHDRARRACRSAAGLAARGVGFNGAIRGCLCIFRSLIQNGILTHDRATRGTPDSAWGYRGNPRRTWLAAISYAHSPPGRSVTARLNR
ncbi:hypothetical protein C6T58_15300 [Burkholderia multivorans]|nr:hypothetical protein BURMUCF2_2791 [Burkholderia multivorans CF2]PRF44710.1 hypothetical protein C6Q11_14010 [Burkholderia multivorans]PRG81234.1 hypothetical protein C6T58_15300 [Burkholderia multivorans]